jgi:hypothetical protein
MLLQRARYGLAQVYESLCDVEKARENYKKVASAEPDSAIGQLAQRRYDQIAGADSESWFAWFDKQVPKPPAGPVPAPGQGPNVPADLGVLPESPDLPPPGNELIPAPTTEAKPEVAPEAKPAMEPEAKPAAEPEAKPATQPEEKPAPAPEAKPAMEPEAKPEPAPEAKPATQPEEKPAPAPEAKPTTEPEAKPEPAPEAKPAEAATPPAEQPKP